MREYPAFVEITTPDGPVYIDPTKVQSIGPAHIPEGGTQTVRWVWLSAMGHDMLDTPENLEKVLVNLG